jgi:hypothetical protein
LLHVVIMLLDLLTASLPFLLGAIALFKHIKNAENKLKLPILINSRLFNQIIVFEGLIKDVDPTVVYMYLKITTMEKHNCMCIQTRLTLILLCSWRCNDN